MTEGCRKSLSIALLGLKHTVSTEHRDPALGEHPTRTCSMGHDFSPFAGDPPHSYLNTVLAAA
jgi:hypothetical protein